MKTFRYIVVGLVLGGASGVKIGAYLSNLWNQSLTYDYIEAGFIYGSLAGSFSALIFLAAFALASLQRDANSFSANRMMSST